MLAFTDFSGKAGGAIRVEGGARVSIIDSYFVDNNALAGSAVYISEGSSVLELTRSYVEGNAGRCVARMRFACLSIICMMSVQTWLVVLLRFSQLSVEQLPVSYSFMVYVYCHSKVS